MSEMESTTRFEVGDAVEIEVRAESGGKVRLVAFYTGGDEETLLHADDYPRRFWKQRTARGQIKNEIVEALRDTPLDESAFEREWKQEMGRMVANGDEAMAEVVPETVRELAEGTEYVHVGLAGETRKWEIRINWKGKTGEIAFDHNEMANGGAGALKSQLFKEFADSPDVEPEDWAELRDFWIEIQEETVVETATETERAVESFLDSVRSRIVPHEQPEALMHGKETAWVDWENTHGVRCPNVTDPEAVVWVRGDLVSEILDSLESAPRIGVLGEELGKLGATARGSGRYQPCGNESKRRYWFFTPDALNLTEMEIHSEPEAATSEVDV